MTSATAGAALMPNAFFRSGATEASVRPGLEARDLADRAGKPHDRDDRRVAPRSREQSVDAVRQRIRACRSALLRSSWHAGNGLAENGAAASDAFASPDGATAGSSGRRSRRLNDSERGRAGSPRPRRPGAAGPVQDEAGRDLQAGAAARAGAHEDAAGGRVLGGMDRQDADVAEAAGERIEHLRERRRRGGSGRARRPACSSPAAVRHQASSEPGSADMRGAARGVGRRPRTGPAIERRVHQHPIGGMVGQSEPLARIRAAPSRRPRPAGRERRSRHSPAGASAARAQPTSSGSRSTPVTCSAGARAASAERDGADAGAEVDGGPAASAGTSACSSAASSPARCPLRGCTSVTSPPRKASTVLRRPALRFRRHDSSRPSPASVRMRRASRAAGGRPACAAAGCRASLP